MKAAERSPLRVVVVEDSPTQQAQIVRVLEAEGDIEVVGTAITSSEALKAVQATNPDAVTMDLFIPGGGLEAVSAIVSDRRVPIIVLSAGVAGGTTAAVRALAAGAVDAVPKPTRWDEASQRQLRSQVRALRGVHPRLPRRDRRSPLKPGEGSPVVGIGASTGGPAALSCLLSGLVGLAAPVLLVQHIHASFVEGFSEWLATSTEMPVVLASHGEQLRPGVVYVAGPDRHLKLAPERRSALDPEPHSVHRPSVDVLFSSVAQHAGRGGVGVLLTGMGEDGARGLLALREAGGATIAQDEASSTVWGMPRAAVRLGGASDVLALEDIAPAVRQAVATVLRRTQAR